MKLAPSPSPRVYERGDRLVVLGADGVARELSGDSALLARAVLDFVTGPRDRAEVFAHLAALAGAPVEPASVVDELLALLCASGVLVEESSAPAQRPSAPPPRRRRLVLGLTGAVQTVRAAELVGRLLARGFDLEIALTRDARRFVTAIGLEALTHRRVHRGLWQRDLERPVPHIQLAEWAELVLVCPASATTIGRIAHGDCSDLVSAIAIATRAPVLVAPSMNLLMLTAPSVQRNLERLRADGFHVLRPGYGVEAARGPEARTVGAGPSASLDAVVDVARFLVDGSTRSGGGAADGAQGRAWEQLYAGAPLAELPWFTDALDPDLAAALDRLGAAAGRLLDLGSGPGTQAIELARRGFTVTASDVAPSAVAAARGRPGGGAVAWQVDDILDSRLDERFDLVIDRGCMHALPPHRLADWAAAVARLTEPGGHLLVKTYRRGEPHPDGALGFTPLAIAELCGDAFDLIHSARSRFTGRSDTAAALFCVLSRR